MVNAPPLQPKPEPFPIPDTAVAQHPDLILAPRQLSSWIDGLPFANPPRAAEELLHQLRLLVRDPQPGARFGVMLKIYDKPLLLLLTIVHERLQTRSESAAPLDHLESRLLDLLRELCYGYLRITNGRLAAGKPPEAETLYRAMSLLSNAMTIEWLHYGILAVDEWRLLLKVFLSAEQQLLASESVSSDIRQADDPDTIQGLFFRSLIISLCDPHHRLPSEILSWHRWAGMHAAQLSLTILPQGAFAIPVDFSGAAKPLASARRGKPGPDMRYLAPDQFMQQLQEEETAPEGLYRALSELIRGRKSPEQRQAERQPRNHPYRLIHGVRDIYQRLNEIGEGGTSSVATLPCRQVDQSTSGAAFHLQGPLRQPLTVGEPVLLEAESAAGGGPPVGFAACIQRLINHADQRIEIGVKKIEERLLPVTLSGAASERTRGNDHALLQATAEYGNFILLASRSVYREGDVVAVEGKNARYRLRMRELSGVINQTAFIKAESVDD